MQATPDDSRSLPQCPAPGATWPQRGAVLLAATNSTFAEAASIAHASGVAGLWYVVLMLTFIAIVVGGFYLHGRTDRSARTSDRREPQFRFANFGKAVSNLTPVTRRTNS